MSASRVRRWRERRRRGVCLVTAEVDDVALSEALVAKGFLDANRDDDPAEIRSAFQRFINWLLAQ